MVPNSEGKVVLDCCLFERSLIARNGRPEFVLQQNKGSRQRSEPLPSGECSGETGRLVRRPARQVVDVSTGSDRRNRFLVHLR
jgi:hypothetical protein